MTRWKITNWYQLSIQKWVQGIILTVWNLNNVITRLEIFKRIIDDELCEFTTHPPYLYHLIIMVFAPKIDIRVWLLRQRGQVDLGTLGAPTTGRASFFGVFIALESLLCCIILHCDVVYHCLGIFVWCGLCESLLDCITFYIVLYCIVWESLLCHIILNHYFIIIQWLYYYSITMYCIVMPGSLYWSSSEKLAWHGNLALESALTSYFTIWTGLLLSSIIIDFMTFLVSMEPSP